MSNDFFCPLPWNHLMFRSGGQVQACCETYKDPFEMASTIAETANNSIMKKLRLELLDPNTVPSMCWKCNNREKLSDDSVRTFSLKTYHWWDEEQARSVTNADGSMDNFHLEYLDIRWSNLCNYKCRFCGLSSSNLWLKEAKMLGMEVSNVNPKTGIAEFDMKWDDFKTHLPYVKKIKMAGGEPTIMPGTYQMLEEIIRVGNTDIALSLITNGTTIKYGKYDLLEQFSHFKGNKNKRIQISAEGMGQRHAWARSAKDDWHIVDANVKQYAEFVRNQGPQWHLNFHAGISWMNMYHLADMVEYYSDIEFVFNIVQDPFEMSIMNFYKKDLDRASNFYSDRIQSAQKPLVIKHLNKIKGAIDYALDNTKEDIDLNEFRRVQGLLDTSRKQSFALAYPEWSHYA
tara:strand:+ start:2827 stop:4029 length:1203 start_codon:yes stop_codon:yes gene_type:complete